MAENNGRASGRAASRAIRLRHQLSALSCQLSVISSLRLGRWEYRFFAATSPKLFPGSRHATLSTIRRRLRELRARATRRLLLASRRIPLSYPLREPLPPSAAPSPARRAGNQSFFRPDFLPHFLQCTAHTPDAVARQSRRVRASLRQQQSGVAPAWQPEYPRQPSAPSDLNCSN